MFVKVIASLGPASGSVETIERMVRSGVNGFRINFAHGDPEQWVKLVEAVRRVEEVLGRPLALIGDLKGPSVRVGVLKEPVTLSRGESARMILASECEGGEEAAIPVPEAHFFEAAEVGDVIVMDDGRVRLRVTDKGGGDEIEVTALTEARITSHKAIVIRGKDYGLPAVSREDSKNIDFALENGFDYISLSYVRRGDDLLLLKEILEKKGRKDVGVIAKVETKSAVENLGEIIEVADVVMVARGDLGMNFSLEDIHHYQRLIVSRCLRRRKPVIVATQLLESMIENPVPTRAEVVDISTAVEQGVDALMLTGETSIGKHPVEAVTWLRRVIDRTEARMGGQLDAIAEAARHGELNIFVRFDKGVVELAEDLKAKLVVFSRLGMTPKAIASLRPRIPVYVGASDIRLLRKLSILWGLHPIRVEARDYDEGLAKAFEIVRSRDYVNIGDVAVLTYGLRGTKQVIEIMKVTA